ncbi:MAG: 2-phosphoglycolate phosphatase [Gammaproteobacteria bacterium]
MTLKINSRPTNFLFDLDGTLLDTAPDLASALNRVRAKSNLRPIGFEKIRPLVSHGSYALSRLGCEFPEQSTEFEQFRLDLLDQYAQNLALETRLFEGMDQLLLTLENSEVPWGIVTNKPAWLTDPLLSQLELDRRAAVIVSGDTIAQKKPHPAPLLLAAERMRALASQCVYIGDAERDITGGKAAGMRTIAVRYGYLADGESPDSWGADVIVNSASEIIDWFLSF